MPIAESDIEHRLSGGASITDPNLALGGAMSTVVGGIIITNTQNNDMNDITSAEATSGITIYHGYYYKNNHGSLTYQNAVMWIDSQTSSGDTSVEIAMGDEIVNVAIETIINETIAPVGPVFTSPATKGAGLTVATTLNAGDFRGHWIKYIVNPAATAVLDQYTVKAEGDSDP